MPTINNIEFLTLPQQVNKNKEDVRVLQDGVANLNDEIILKANTTLVNTKADKLVLTNLVSNGDLTIAKPSPYQNQPLGFTYIAATDISLSGGIATFTATAQSGRMILQDITPFNTTDIFYQYARIRSSNPYVGIIDPRGNFVFHSGSGLYELISSYGIFLNVYYFGQVIDRNTTNFLPVSVDYVGAINLTAIFGKGKEPTKEQMDLILRYTGFFQNKELNLVDVFKILATPTQEDWKPVSLLNGNVASGGAWAVPQYMKDSMGFVHFKGNITSAGTGYAKNITVMPNGYKPDRNVYFTVVANGSPTTIYLDAGGNMWMVGTDVSRPLTDLSSITYQAKV